MGMVEFIGLIKVNIVRGKNLVVRDLVTSDPYVILTLGHQVREFAEKPALCFWFSSDVFIWQKFHVILTVSVNENTGDKEQLKSCVEWNANVVDSRSRPTSKAGKLILQVKLW